MAGQAHRFFGDFLGNAADLENDASGLDNCNIVIDRAFTATHAGLGWLGGNRLVREDANPDFTTALHETGERDTRGLDLAGFQPAGFQRLQPEFTKGKGVATRGVSLHTTAMLFAVLKT